MLQMCSKRTRRWIKSFRVHRQDLKIEVTYYFSIRVEIKSHATKEYLVFKFTDHTTEMNRSIGIGNHQDIPMNIEIVEDSAEYFIFLYFDDKMKGLKAVTEYFCSLFQQDIYGVGLSSALNPNAPMTVMEWILERQQRIHYLMMGSENMSEKVAAYLLSKVNNAESVMVELQLSSNFRSSFKFEGDDISIQESHWFTLDNLLNISCFNLFLVESKLTSMDMNAFLKHWMTRDLKFKEITIGMEVMQLDVLFSEISVIQRTNDVKRVYKNSENRSFHIYGGFDIKRKDGVTATVVHNGGFEVKRKFWMIVWDN
uniref:FBA_2 domain-containing protein n=1 Tax=Caenorhabditis tropicalis TaxID=1561998 RepID=A0A1I7TT42_9PELO